MLTKTLRTTQGTNITRQINLSDDNMRVKSILRGVESWALAALVAGIASPNRAAGQQQFAVVRGTVTEDTPRGKANVPKARVEILYPESVKGRRVWKGVAADEASEYEIENVGEREYQLVACDDLLTYTPQHRSVNVLRNGPTVDFKLSPYNTLAARPVSLLYPIDKSKRFLYLKHIETGCEFGAMKAKPDGLVEIPNTDDQQTFYSRYYPCEDDVEEPNSGSAFESCLMKELRGVTRNQVDQKLEKSSRRPKKVSDHEWIYYYMVAQVTLVDGKVAKVKVELEPPTCVLGMRCPGD